MKLSLWFIRQKSTGYYIPDGKGWYNKGGSWAEFGPKTEDARIFRSKLSAKRFLGQWLRGGHKAHYSYEEDYRYVDDITIVPKPHRIPEDIEIIEKEIEL